MNTILVVMQKDNTMLIERLFDQEANLTVNRYSSYPSGLQKTRNENL